MASHRSLTDSNSLQVSRILLSILSDLNTAVVWMISTCPLLFNPPDLLLILWWLYRVHQLQLISPSPLCIIYSLRVFQICLSRWSFTGVWETVSLLKSPGFFSVFWSISLMQWFGWSQLVLLFPSPPVLLLILRLPYQARQLRLVINVTFMFHSFFYNFLAISWYLSFFSFSFNVTLSSCNIPMIRICEIDIGNPKYTTFTKLVQVRKYITFELKVIRHEERKRHNLSMLTAFTSSALNPSNARRP